MNQQKTRPAPSRDVLRDDSLSDLFREAVAQADVAISITDPHANILYVNPAFERVTGYSAQEAVGKNQSMLSAKATPDGVYAALWTRIAAGTPWSGQLVNRRKDGREYLAELLITPVVDGNGTVGSYLGIHRDISELHRLECQVQNQKTLIESVVDSAPVAIALLDGEDCVVLDNREYKKLMGELGMVEPATVILDAVRAEVGHGLGPAHDGQHAFSDREIRIELPSRRGVRWFSCTGTWVKSEDEGAEMFFGHRETIYLLLVAREITVQRQQQEKARMAALQAMLSEENRVGALRESLSAAIFQMEKPLNMVASVVSVLERRGQHDPSLDALKGVLRAGEEALASLHRAMPEPTGEMSSPTNLNEILRDVLDLSTARLLFAGISVSWKPQLVLPSVQASPNRLRTMIKALIDNAMEAMNTKRWPTRELTIGTRSLSGSIEMLIGDSGPGIPPDLHLKVFEPFYTTKAGGHHAGTGLSMAQQIVTDHGGTIEIDPERKQGCCVRIVLPTRTERE